MNSLSFASLALPSSSRIFSKSTPPNETLSQSARPTVPQVFSLVKAKNIAFNKDAVHFGMAQAKDALSTADPAQLRALASFDRETFFDIVSPNKVLQKMLSQIHQNFQLVRAEQQAYRARFLMEGILEFYNEGKPINSKKLARQINERLTDRYSNRLLPGVYLNGKKDQLNVLFLEAYRAVRVLDPSLPELAESTDLFAPDSSAVITAIMENLENISSMLMEDNYLVEAGFELAKKEYSAHVTIQDLYILHNLFKKAVSEEDTPEKLAVVSNPSELGSAILKKLQDSITTKKPGGAKTE